MAVTPKVHADQSLIHGIKIQDRKVLNRIYKDYFPGIRSFIVKNNGTDDEAKDIFQEVLIVIFRKAKADSLTLTSPFSSYLITLSRNMWYNVLKKKSFTSGVTIEELDVSIDDSDLLETINQRAQDKLYREKFAQLGEDCQKVLQLFFAGKKMEKIAQLMGYGSVSYAKKRKFKCKEQLVELIEQDARYRELI